MFFLSSCSDVRSSQKLQKFLKVQKLANLNVEGRSTTDVDSLCFSDSAQIALTAGRDKTLRLFQVNEKKCVKLHSVFFDDLPIQRAVFLPRRHEVLCLGYKKPFYLYDLESGAATRVPHLMGQLENKWSDVVPSPDGQYRFGFVFCFGSLLFVEQTPPSAFLGGESGNVVLFSNRSRQAAFTLKAGGPVSCAAFSADGGPYLWTSGAESEIWQW
jgi:U3 small nucleolar RNA-associated protein 18